MKTKEKGKKKKVPVDPYASGEWPYPDDYKLRTVIRSERFENQQEDMREIESLQRYFSSKQGFYIPSTVLQKAYLMPIDEEKKEIYGDHQYVQRKD